jgi:hypothetical protein
MQHVHSEQQPSPLSVEDNLETSQSQTPFPMHSTLLPTVLAQIVFDPPTLLDRLDAVILDSTHVHIATLVVVGLASSR